MKNISSGSSKDFQWRTKKPHTTGQASAGTCKFHSTMYMHVKNVCYICGTVEHPPRGIVSNPNGLSQINSFTEHIIYQTFVIKIFGHTLCYSMNLLKNYMHSNTPYKLCITSTLQRIRCHYEGTDLSNIFFIFLSLCTSWTFVWLWIVANKGEFL